MIAERAFRKLLGGSLLLIALAAAMSAVGDTPSSEKSSALYEDALVRFNRGDFRGAVIQLKNALQGDPHNLSARILIGRAYLRLGYPAGAEKELRIARRDGADEAVVLIPLANAYLQQAKFDELYAKIPPGRHEPEMEAKILSAHGEAYIQQGRLNKAREVFEYAAFLSPNSAAPLVGQAKVALHRGDHLSAEGFAQAATDREPGSADAWFVRGDIRRLRQDVVRAIEFYDKSLAIDPYHFPARLSRAALLIDLDRDQSALEDLKTVRAVRPHDPQASYLNALILARTGNLEQAREALERTGEALASVPTDFLMRHPPSLLLLGVINYSQRKFDEAYSYLSRYLALQPRHPGARKLLGAILLSRGEPEAAIAALTPALELAPDDAELMALLGQAYMQDNQYEKGTELLDKASTLAPNVAAIRTGLALSRLALGDTKSAIGDLESALSLDSGGGQAAMLLGLVQLKQGEFDAALKTAETLIEREPANPAAHNLLGTVQAAQGDLGGARARFEQAVAIDPSYLTARRNLAKLDQREGRVERAIQRYRQIVEENPRDTQSMIALGRFALNEDRLDDAIQWLEKVRASDPKAMAAQLELIGVYLRIGDYFKAQHAAQELEGRFPEHVPVLVIKGRVQLAAGKRDMAVRTFRRASRFAVYSANQLYAVARYQVAADDIDGARWSLQKASQGDPNYLAARIARIELEMGVGNLDDALARASQLRAQRPELPVGDLLAGDVLMRMGRHPEAANAYSAGLAKEGSAALVVRYYRARKASGDDADALAALEQWLRKHPDSLEARRALAAGYIDAGRLREATAAHERLLRAMPDDAALLNNLATLYQKAGDSRALEYARKAHSLAPKEAATLDTLGWILVERDDPQEALKYLREARDRASRDPRVRYHLAVALSRLGRREEARRELESALAADTDFENATEARILLRELAGS